MSRQLCIHGHFYQPPRENPWLEEVELQDGAYPYHDWNERVSAECYAPNAASRILGPDKRIIDIVNNYEKISFDFGPTLLSWMERHSPELYKAIIEVDARSRSRFGGHGSAIAQVYNHMIMPLANSRDRRTQVIWGIADFEHRFKRVPEGMWLPETAVNLESLDILAEQGIKFTILSPYQAKRVKHIHEQGWRDVSGGRIDPKTPYLQRLPSGRSIAIFFYDGPISNDVAFGSLLNNGENFAGRLMSVFSSDPGDQLVNIATDGETYGHHHRFGDMALAYCLHHVEERKLAEVTIYGEYLEKHPPVFEVEILENTSWSCSHGVDRWRKDCGDNTGAHGTWSQQWRAPLREAMNWLRDVIADLYEKGAADVLSDPWAARDDYVNVVLDRNRIDAFLSKHAKRGMSAEGKVKALKLLEMQRNSMLTFTSCGWYFDEISGIESVQVMYYAARAMQLARELSGVDLEPDYLDILRAAKSNIPEFGNGARVYEMLVKPYVLDLLRVGAHYSVSSLFEEYPRTSKIYSFTARSEDYERVELGRQKLAVGRAKISSDITLEEEDVCFAVIHLGDHNIHAAVKVYVDGEFRGRIVPEIKSAFLKGDVPGVMRLLSTHFGTHNYSLWHLFKDEQRKVLNQVLKSTLAGAEASFRQVYEHNFPMMQVMRETGIPLPKTFATTLELMIDVDLRTELERSEPDLDRLKRTVDESRKWPVDLDRVTLNFVASRRVDALMELLYKNPDDVELLAIIGSLVKILGGLPFDLNLWKTQNIYFRMTRENYPAIRDKAAAGEGDAKIWAEHFEQLGRCLYVRCE